MRPTPTPIEQLIAEADMTAEREWHLVRMRRIRDLAVSHAERMRHCERMKVLKARWVGVREATI